MAINRLTSWIRGPRKTRKALPASGVRLTAQKLEDRTAPAIFTVTWDGDPSNPNGPQPAGSLTLQDAIVLANANPGPDQINYGGDFITGAPVVNSFVFSAAKAGSNNGPLSQITDTLVIDGSPLAGPGKIVVHLNSSSAANAVNGFYVTGAAANTIIRDIDITDDAGTKYFNSVPTEFGVKIDATKGGVNLQNMSINFIDGDAVRVVDSPNNIIGGAGSVQAMLIGTVAAPNNGNGVRITGASSTNNLVQQSTIFGNAGDGVLIDGSAANNIVGGFTDSPVNSGNIIGQNAGSGVHLNNSSGNRIQRNFIGNDTAKVAPNAGQGILVENGSANNIIGGNDLTAGNKISGNTENGIYIRGKTSSGNQIQSNLIGIDPTTTNKAMPNSGNGILVEGAANTFVGSTTTAANYISGNNLNGVLITGDDSAGSVVVNNRVGIAGTNLIAKLDTKLGNVQDGVALSTTKNVTVGGGGTNAQNIIGANRNGIAVFSSTGVTLKGNQLGVNKLSDGTYPNLGNLQDGILIQNSNTLQVGGTQSLEGNKAAANRNGIHVIGSTSLTMQGNIIGPNFTGTNIPPPFYTNPSNELFEPVFQAEDGILVESSSDVKIGTPAQGGGNLISHNRHGISITKGSSNVLIQNNLVGTQSIPSRTPDLGNQDDGVFIDNSTNVLIGGTVPLSGNTLAKNLDGIQISGGSSGVTVQGNLLRNNRQSGVRIEASSNSLVGGNVAAAKNTIINRRLAFDSTFQIDGVFLVSGSFGNTVQGNWIGTDSTNSSTLFNTGNGVLIDGSSNNTIGGAIADPVNGLAIQNVIAFNSFNGIAVVESTGTANGNQLLGNSVYNNGRLGIDLGTTAGVVSPNDDQDPDLGANRTQNFPVLTFAESGSAFGTHIQGSINSTPFRTFRLEFFGIDVPNPGGNPANFGQGKTYLGTTTVTTDLAGNFNLFDFFSANIVIPAAQYVSATATDVTTLDTSEFSLAQVVQGAPGPATYIVTDDGGYYTSQVGPNGNPDVLPAPTTQTLARAIRLANEHPGADRIVFSIAPEYSITSNGALNYDKESRWVWTNGDLPDITDTVIIDGSPLAWPQSKGGDKNYTDNYSIIFNKGSHGLLVSDNPTVQAKFSNPNATASLVVFRHLNVSSVVPGVGIELASKFGNSNIQDVSIGFFGSDGVRITNSPGNIVGGSGANQAVTINSVAGSGVNIIGSASINNLVQQTNIGTTFGAGGNGIWIQGANNNTVGGFVTGSGVRIQASGANGIYLVNSNGTRIQRSTIGDPANLFPNHFDGIRVENSASTLIGGVTSDAGNTIAGNTEQGIHAIGSLSAGLQIQSNKIGTPAAPNSGNGIFVDNVANVLIGSTVTAANNIDGNNLNGILIQGASSAGARIVNTSVGAGGGNLIDGIVVDGVSDVIIGGSGSNMGGTINGNRRGVSILNNSSKITVQQYTIQNNSEEGIRIDTSSGILIGGTASLVAGNKVQSNRDGIRTINSSVVTLQQNQVLNQSEDGVIIDSTGSVIVGSPFQSGGNIINSNRNGVRVINGSIGFSIENNTLNSNRDDAIRLDGITGAKIGGTQPLSPNTASGNRNGLHLTNGTSGTIVLQNTFANGTESGIVLEGSSNNIIGGKTVQERNLSFGNALYGVFFKPDFTNPLNPIFSNNNTVQGNYIGVDKTLAAKGNGSAGIYIDGGSNNLIGGKIHDKTNPLNILEQGNIIANSGASGVSIVTDNGPAAGNSILGNQIYDNGKLGIDLGSNLGLVIPNDVLDPDTGANNFQNFPIIITAETGSLASVVTGKFNSTANRTFRLEFFGSPSPNPNGTPSGYGQGKTYLGSVDATTNGSGDALFNFSALVPLTLGSWVSATATDLTTGDTSEMALAVQTIDAKGSITGQKFNDLNGNGVKDAGEPGLAGWEIDLDFNNDGTIDDKRFTDGGGNYSFTRLTDGIYKISEVNKLSGWVQTMPLDINKVGTFYLAQITGELPVLNQDFGNFQIISVSGHKFEDKDGSGKQDAGEGSLSGVTINLWQILTPTTKKLLAQTTTDLSGNYIFQNLGPLTAPLTNVLGPITLQVTETVPTGYTQTTANPAPFAITSGKNVTGLDFGNKKTGGGGGGGGTSNTIIVVGADSGALPQVRAVNATDQSAVFSFLAYGAGFRGGVRVAKGDVNGDGVKDIITAAGPGGGPHVKVFDGTNAGVIRSFYAYGPTFGGGAYVASADVNGDGFADIITGAGAGGGPHVKAFDGKSGIELFSFFAYGASFSGGVRVSGGDVNGDGFADIITAAGPGGGPHVKVFDGSTFGQPVAPTTIRSFFAYPSSFAGGVFVTSGKLNADNYADIIVGPDRSGGPEVRAFDGFSGQILLDFMAYSAPGTTQPPSLFNGDAQFSTGVRVGVADINADGIDDVVTGLGAFTQPVVNGFNGLNATKLASFFAFDPSFMGGVFVG